MRQQKDLNLDREIEMKTIPIKKGMSEREEQILNPKLKF